MRRATLLVATLMAFALSLGATSEAGAVSAASDPRDARRSPFDIKSLGVAKIVGDSGHGKTDWFLFVVDMWERWYRDDLACGATQCGIVIDLDTRGDERADFLIRFDKRGRRVVAELYQKRPRKLVRRASPRAEKNPTEVRVDVETRFLDLGRTMRWRAWSVSDGIVDHAPDTGWIEYEI